MLSVRFAKKLILLASKQDLLAERKNRKAVQAMSDEEIKKCLEHCVAKGQCKKCPLDKELLCFPVLEKNALDLINRQQADIDDLKRDTVPKLQDSLNRANKYGRATDRENARLKAEIERLQGAVQEWVDGKCLSQKHLLMIGKLQNEIEQAKSEAIKEFAVKLKCGVSITSGVITCADIDNLVAEMAGGENA